MIGPGATLGVLGGGQLGRMFAHAAQAMGYRVLVLDPKDDPPAAHAADGHLCADYDDGEALAELARCCAGVTAEFENVPADSLVYLDGRCRLAPGPDAVAVARDRIREKTFLAERGIDTAEFAVIETAEEVAGAADRIGAPARMKTATLGYDGRGQAPVTEPGEAEAAFRELGEVPCVLEREVPLAGELSVVLARGAEGAVTPFPAVENIHRNGILDSSIFPARVPGETREAAEALAREVAEALDYQGVLAVELFQTDDGELLVNELAPRPHNSGHITLDACATSQFEQQVRMLCRVPAGSPEPLSAGAMINLLSERWDGGEPDWLVPLGRPTAKLHLYGKEPSRPGRKMGHINVLGPDADAAAREAGALSDELG